LYEARHRELEKRGPTDTPNLRRLGFDVLGYPRMDGSTSTMPLSILITCRCFDMPSAWVGSRPLIRGRYGDEDDFMLSAGPALPPPEPEFSLAEFAMQAKPATPAQERLAAIINRLIVSTPDTHEAYVRLIEGRSEFGLLARGPSPAELDLARQKGVELQTAPCALDALVFLVNDENDVNSLTTEQIRGIYSGKITRWQEVGSAVRSATPSGTEDAAVTPYQREEQSGSQELMRTLVMKELQFVKWEAGRGAPQLIINGMGGPYVVLQSHKNGLAYSVYYYERYMAGSARTKVIAVDGVEPTDDSIRTRKYPFVSEVLIVTRKDLDPKAPAARLRDWLLSPEGQAVVYESGYVPLPANSSK
jgi:phosphate transport system substrate-binding protein